MFKQEEHYTPELLPLLIESVRGFKIDDAPMGAYMHLLKNGIDLASPYCPDMLKMVGVVYLALHETHSLDTLYEMPISSLSAIAEAMTPLEQ